MNGIDAVVIATGNDWRAVEAGAHAFAARSGSISRSPFGAKRGEPRRTAGGPMALGTVGGTLRVHPGARLSLQMLGVKDAASLPASPLPLASHRTWRPCAPSPQMEFSASHGAARAGGGSRCGALGDCVERVAQMIVEARDITLDGAKKALNVLSAEDGEGATAIED